MLLLRTGTSNRTIVLFYADEVTDKARYTQIPLSRNSTNTQVLTNVLLTHSLTPAFPPSLTHSLTHSLTQTRLNKFIEQHNILNPEQFRSNARTTDSLFILRQLLHKYTKQHKKLYVGLIDYEKAFDSVWQFGMIQKLHKYGIQGKFLNIIKSMYSSIKSCVKIDQSTLTGKVMV